MSTGLSAEELERICEKLQRKVTRYETKFSDLVNAYKQLAEEKNALEDTVKALSKNDKKNESQFKSFFQKSKELVTKSKSAGIEETQDDEITKEALEKESKEELEKRFSVLTASYQSLLESKTKMEKVYQEDKKAVLNEHNILVANLKDEKVKLTAKVDELRAKLLQEQHERNADQKHHSSIMKELQNVVTEERLQKDEVHMQLHECKTTIETLNCKVEYLSPPPAEILQKSFSVEGEEMEMEKLKKDLLDEQRKLKEAEGFFTIRLQQEEDRIFQLENKVSELSSTIGEYEMQRNEDQLLIKKLRHKLDNLDAEKSALLVNVKDENKESEEEKEIESPRLQLTSSYLSESDDFVANDNMSIAYYDTDELHHKCHLDYKNLKADFENFKQKYTRVQQERDQKNTQLAALRAGRDRLTGESKEKERDFLELMSKLQLENTKLSDEYEDKLETLQTSNTKQINSLQLELQKQRNRSMDLISEKDYEIEKLQRVMYDQDGLLSNESRTMKKFEAQSKKENFISNQSENNIMSEILSSPTKTTDVSLFHFIEQTSYEKELSLLRMRILTVEGQNRDFEQREEHILQQMQLLKEEIRRLERNRSRESANLEYLKNICFRYMMTSSSSVKKQMSVAISSILQFSKNETQELEKRRTAGWW